MDQSGEYSELQTESDGESTTVRIDYGIAQWQGVEVTIAVINGLRWALISDVGPLFGSGMEFDRIWRLCPETDRCLLDGLIKVCLNLKHHTPIDPPQLRRNTARDT